MHHETAALVRQLTEALGTNADDLAALSDATAIDGITLGRVLRGDEEPKLDHAMTVARTCGLVLMLAPKTLRFPSAPPGVFRNRGAAPMAQGDLIQMRDTFSAWRKTTGMTPTALARALDFHDKAILRIESGNRTPRMTSVIDYAAAYELMPVLIRENERPAAIAELEADRRRRGPNFRQKLATRPKPPAETHPTPAQVLGRALARTAEDLDLPPRAIAQLTGLHVKTLMGPDRRLTPLGQFSTTVKIATALGLEIVVAPHAALTRIAGACSPFRPDPVALPPDQFAADVARQIRQVSDRIGGVCRDMKRDGLPTSDIARIRDLTSSLRNSHTEHLAERFEEIGFSLIAVPVQAVRKSLALAESVRSSPRKSRPVETRESTQLRNRRLMLKFFRQLELRSAKKSLPQDLPSQRTPLQQVLEHMDTARLSMDVVERGSGDRVLRYRGRQASDFMAEIVSLRLARGVSRQGLGAAGNLSLAGVRRVENETGRPNVLLSSVLRYAETLGLDLVPNR